MSHPSKREQIERIDPIPVEQTPRRRVEFGGTRLEDPRHSNSERELAGLAEAPREVDAKEIKNPADPESGFVVPSIRSMRYSGVVAPCARTSSMDEKLNPVLIQEGDTQQEEGYRAEIVLEVECDISGP